MDNRKPIHPIAGYFELQIRYTKFLRLAQLIFHHQEGETYSMRGEGEEFSSELRSVRHILIDTATVDLKLSTNTYEKYNLATENYCLERFQSGENHDDLRLRLEIHSKIYYIFAGEELIETRTYKSHLVKS